MRKVAVFDDFAYACNFYTSEYNVNNYYGCTHPEQEETDPDEDGIKRGKCYCHSCPLGSEAEIGNFDNPDIDWCGIEKEETLTEQGTMVEGEYIVVDVGYTGSTEEKQAWLDYEARINRYNKNYVPSFEIVEVRE